MLKSALESLFQDIVEFKKPEIYVCLNRNEKTVLFFTMISSFSILLTYSLRFVSATVLFWSKTKITSRNSFSRRSIPAAEDEATCPPIPLLEFREQFPHGPSKQTSKLCSLPTNNSEIKLIPSQSNGLMSPPTLSLPSILPVPKIIEPLNDDTKLKENQNSNARQILPLTRNESQNSSSAFVRAFNFRAFKFRAFKISAIQVPRNAISA